MNPEIFVNTSGFYALLIKTDDMHKAAGNILQKAPEKKVRFGFVGFGMDS